MYKEIKGVLGPANIRYIIYEPVEIHFVALAIHGGCFQDGDETWNTAQSIALAKKNILVMQLNFRQDSHEHTLEDLIFAAAFLRMTYLNISFGVIGSSSGGFYSLVLTNKRFIQNISFCINICPVANPFLRFIYLKTSTHPKKDDMLRKQLTHFGNERRMEQLSKLTKFIVVNVPMLTIIADDDINVPNNSTNYLQYCSKYIIVDGEHSKLCSGDDDKVINNIVEFLKNIK